MGGPGGGVGAISEGMIGMPDGPAPDKDTPPLAATLSKKGADGTPVYTSAITGLLDTAESAVLIRNLLAGAARRQRHHRAGRPGRPAWSGCSTCIVRGPQIEAKCKQLVVAAGSFPAGPPDADDQERCGRGQEVCSPSGRRRSSRSDPRSATRCRTPARASTRISRGRPCTRSSTRTGRSSRCPTTHPRRRWPRCSTPCTPMTGTSSCPTRARSRVLDDGRTKFTPAAEGKHRYLIVDPAQKERVIGCVHRDGFRPAGAAAGPRTGWQPG